MENSLVHFTAVLLLSLAAAWLLCRLRPIRLPANVRAWRELDTDALRSNAQNPERRPLVPACSPDGSGQGGRLRPRSCARCPHPAAGTVCGTLPWPVLQRASPCAGRGIRGDILILGWTRPRAGRRFSPRWRLTQTVVSAEHGRELARQGIPDSGPSGTGYRHAPDWHPCGGTAAAPGRIVAPWRAAGDRGSFSHLCVSDDLSGESCAFHPTAGPPDSAMPLTG